MACPIGKHIKVLPPFLADSVNAMKAAWDKLDRGEKYLRWDCDYCNLQTDINNAEVNWGFLYNTVTDEMTLAPVYDCGSSLYPQADEAIMESVLTDENERNFRIFDIPTSAITMNGSRGSLTLHHL